MAECKVIITTSGLGSRLGNLTEYTNKSLVRIGDLPIISHIINSYPKDTELIITLGHFGSHVRQYVTLAHSDRNITFVDIPIYSGPNSSLGLTLLACRHLIDGPFIFHAGDTIVLDDVPVKGIYGNWIGISDNTEIDSSNYRTIKLDFIGDVSEIQEKGAIYHSGIYIGLAHIAYWEKFFEYLESEKTREDLSDIHAINKLISNRMPFKRFRMRWLDCGNSTALISAREKIPCSYHVLDKVRENIFMDAEHVYKFNSEPQVMSCMVSRYKILERSLPKNLEFTENFIKYSKVKGFEYSKCITADNVKNFVEFAFRHLWVNCQRVDDDSMEDFYRTKTLNRIKDIPDKEECIRGVWIPTAKELIDKIPWIGCMWYRLNVQVHGDLVLDNIIFNPITQEFTLIDWRASFAGYMDRGDIYYDLAKFNHSLIIQHEMLESGNFTADEDLEFSTSNRLTEVQPAFKELILQREDIQWQKVEILTALIWLNMAPLHGQKIQDFLFKLGKYYLYKALKNE